MNDRTGADALARLYWVRVNSQVRFLIVLLSIGVVVHARQALFGESE